MEWTRETPSKEGLYWTYSDSENPLYGGGSPTIVYVFEWSHGGEWGVSSIGSEETDSMGAFVRMYEGSLWWQGPIPFTFPKPPQEAQP